jgi:tetratricopeptide (TPR) repeat protein
MHKSSPDKLFDEWLQGSKFVAREARALMERFKSAATLARLAHAELAAQDTDAAEVAAVDALDFLVSDCERKPQAEVDIPAAISAAWVLIIAGKSDHAESRLSKLPGEPPVLIVRANLAVDANDFSKALELLRGCSFPEADSLRGYVYLRLNDTSRALTELRRAYHEGAPNADVCANLAAAFWIAGSRRKSLNFIRQASRLAPGRKDISLRMLDLIISSHEIGAAKNEIKSILHRGVIETAELAIRQAQIAMAENMQARALSLLRRAEGLALSADDKPTATQINGRIAMLRLSKGDIDKDGARRKLRKAMDDAPGDVTLVYMFSDLCDKVRRAPELRSRYERMRGEDPDPELLPIETKLAYLECRFDDYCSLAMKWYNSQPLNPFAAKVAILACVYATQDLKQAAHLAKALHSRFPWDSGVANNAAYVCVLAGKPDAAERILSDTRLSGNMPEYVLLATKGLVEIAKGDIQAGLRLYRRSAEAADRLNEGMLPRILVTLSQGLGLQLIGQYQTVMEFAMRVGALPPLELPVDWTDDPELRFLAWRCEKEGYVWPPVLP